MRRRVLQQKLNKTVCRLVMKKAGKFNVRVSWRGRVSHQSFVTIDARPATPVIMRLKGCATTQDPLMVTWCPPNATILTLTGSGFATSSPTYNNYRFHTVHGMGSGIPKCAPLTTSWASSTCRLDMFTGRATGEFQIQTGVAHGYFSTQNVRIRSIPVVSQIRGCKQICVHLCVHL